MEDENSGRNERDQVMDGRTTDGRTDGRTSREKMNRILCRRYAVNIFWTAIYGCLVGYVFYANYAARLNPVATLNEEALSVAAVAKQGNGSVDGDDDVIAALRRSQPGKMRARTFGDIQISLQAFYFYSGVRCTV